MTASSQTPDGAQPPPPADPPPTLAVDVDMTRSYDGLTVEAIADEVHKQAFAEFRAGLATVVQAGTQVEDRQALAFFHDRSRTVASLCDGRPLDHMLSVREVLAALDGSMPTQMPLTIAWDGQITDPDGDGPGESTLIACTTSRGGRAVLALDPEQRRVLGGQLLATLHAAEACTAGGCGATADELDGSGPPLFGWIRVQVAGIDGPSRWWCSPACVNSALTAAGAELAAIDRAAAATPDGPEYLDNLYGSGASGEYALQVAEAHEAAVEDERGDVEDGGR